MKFLAEQLLNGIQLGALLFLMASGMTLILGIVRLINLAHGSLYMFGAFFAATFAAKFGSMAIALPAALVATALLGLVLERLILRRLYERSHLDQVLCTFGIILVANETVRLIWGPVPIALPLPESLSGSINLFGLEYSTYRMLYIVVGLGVAILLNLLMNRTRTGMLIRAGASNRTMIQALGTNISLLNSLIFAVGAALAALAGAMAGPLLAVQSGMGEPVLIVVLVVIVVGGVGSIWGSLVAALLIGLIDTFGRVLLPAALGSIIIYLLMAFVLVFRPSGLFPVPGGSDSHSAGPSGSSGKGMDAVRNYRLGTPTVLVLLLAFALVPVMANMLGEPFYIKVFTRIMAVGIAALGLGLIINYGGMVSLGHAAFVGVASYVVAILGFHGSSGASSLGFLATSNAFIVWPVAILVSALMAFLIGLVAVRTAGLSFIMITLAFAQMLFYFFLALPTYGGESGLPMEQRSVLGPLPMDDRTSFYYLVFVVLVACLALVSKLMQSPFGLVLEGSRQNEQRLRAIGIPVNAYRLAAFTLSGAITGVSGVLLVNLQMFATPMELSWHRSGDYIVMVILGGVASLAGPLQGALIFELTKHLLENWTTHWELYFGLLLIAYVLSPRFSLKQLFRERAKPSPSDKLHVIARGQS
jgi:branched-chain amino acid transport system permease protein